MSKRLTLKQLKFIQIYIETGNATKAAMEAYRCKNENVAAVLGSENLRKPNIACEIEKYRKEGGLSIQKAINAINDAYDAEKKGAPDHNVRLRSADMTLKLANAYPCLRPGAEARTDRPLSSRKHHKYCQDFVNSGHGGGYTSTP